MGLILFFLCIINLGTGTLINSLVFGDVLPNAPDLHFGGLFGDFETEGEIRGLELILDIMASVGLRHLVGLNHTYVIAPISSFGPST